MHKETQYDEVFDAQKHYRLLLDAMARPGKVQVIPAPGWTAPGGIHTGSALIAFALLNGDVTFCICGPGEPLLESYLEMNTASRPAAREVADFLFIIGPGAEHCVPSAKRGNLLYPEESATLVVDVARLSAASFEGAELAVSLAGPGVDGTRTMWVSGLGEVFLEERAASNDEFPMGVDIILSDREGNIACIPRSAAVMWEQL